MSEAPRIWALLGAHAGDNNQVLALAEALRLPFEIKQLSYNGWRHLQPRLLGASLRSLSEASRRAIDGDPPDLTISAGHRSVPVVQHLRRRSKGRTRSVHVGYPRIAPNKFDLVVATPEYPVPDAVNVLRIPFALTRTRDGDAGPVGLPHPLRLLILGGPTLYWQLDTKRILEVAEDLLATAEKKGGSVAAVASPRTPLALFSDVTAKLASGSVPSLAVPTGGPPSYASLLAAADALFVTADSVAMVSDAIVTTKPVALIPIEPTLLGRLYAQLIGHKRRMRPRDLRFFWQALAEQELLEGRSALPDVNRMVADRVIEMLRAE